MPYTDPKSITRRRAIAQQMMTNQRRKAPIENILKALGAYKGGLLAESQEAANTEQLQHEMQRMLLGQTEGPQLRQLGEDGLTIDVSSPNQFEHPEVQKMLLAQQLQAKTTQGAQQHDMRKIAAQGQNQLANTGAQGVQSRLTEALKQKAPYNLPPLTERRGPVGELIATNTNVPPSATTVNIGDKADSEFYKSIGKGFGENLVERRGKAETAVKTLASVAEARKLLDEGVRTGSFADFRNNFGRLLHTAGYRYADDPTSNTDAYGGQAATRIVNIMTGFGSGTGLSDEDRKYATDAAAGNKEMTEDALRRLLSIEEQQSRWVIENYNKDASKIKDVVPYDITIEMPPIEMPPAGQLDAGGTYVRGPDRKLVKQ